MYHVYHVRHMYLCIFLHQPRTFPHKCDELSFRVRIICIMCIVFHIICDRCISVFPSLTRNLPQKCDQLLSLSLSRALHASVVATVVRTPRSEVSERHRAGRLGLGGRLDSFGNLVELEMPPHKVGVLAGVA